MLGRWWRGWRHGAVPRWGITMLAREPADLLLAHLAWHIAAGASVLHVFLDDPADPVAEPAAALPGVKVIRCDARFWATHPSGRRPDLIVARQTFCATRAYRDAGVDWLLHLDADEFLFQRTPLARELARNADHPGALVIPVRERILTRPDQQHLFEGPFRVPQQGAQRRAHPLLAPLSELAPAGVIGHSLGKSVTRVGLDVALHPHFPRPAGGGQPSDVPRRPSQSAVLLHFDGLTPLHWLAKMLRRVPIMPTAPEGYLGAHRRAQLALVAACGNDPARLRALHDRLRVVPDTAPFAAAGLIEALPFDPAAACQAVLGRVPDFTVASFDATLRSREAVLLKGL